MEDYQILFVFAVSMCSVLFLTPRFIRKLKKRGHTVKDMYKKDKPSIPTMGGIVILGGVLTSLIVAQFFVPSIETLLIFYLVGINFAMLGLIDDLLDMGRFWKMILPFFLAFPIALLTFDTTLFVGFTSIELGAVYSLFIAPLYVMVVANLVNMHSGFNGLSSGLTLILLCFIELKVFMTVGIEGIDALIYIMPMLGALAGFFYFEKYPSRIFLGNCGALFLGAILGSLLVFNNLEVFGVIIMIPHIVNFLMYVVWRIKKVGEIKFGRIRADGTIEVPNNLTLKWVPPYYFRLTEQQSTLVMFVLTVIFGIIGLVVA